MDARLQVHGVGLQLVDFSVGHTGPDAAEQAQREIRHPPATLEGLEIFHEFARLRGREGLRHSAPPPDAVMRHLENRTIRNPAPVKSELEKRRKDAAAVVEGLQTPILAALSTFSVFCQRLVYFSAFCQLMV